MKPILLKFQKLNELSIPFKRMHEHDACYDVYANTSVTLLPQTTVIIPTGIILEIPVGYEGIIRGRSGLASKGILVHTGTIDAGYRGEVGVIMFNTTNETFKFNAGDRVAQFCLKKVLPVQFEEVETISTVTDRGEKGYGSTGC